MDCATISDTAARAIHLLSEGITYQGAHLVLVAFSADSYAS